MTVRVREFTPGGTSESILGVGAVEVGPVLIRGVRLVQRRDGSGSFIGWPARRDQESEAWTDLVYLTDRAVYEELLTALQEAHRKAASYSPSVDRQGQASESVPF